MDVKHMEELRRPQVSHSFIDVNAASQPANCRKAQLCDGQRLPYLLRSLPVRAWLWQVSSEWIIRIERKTALFRNAFLLVALFECRCDLLLVTSYCCKCIVGYSVCQYVRIEYAHQTVATANPMIEKTKRLAGPVSFQPKCEFAQIHRERVKVYSIDALRNYISHSEMEVFRSRLIFAGAGCAPVPCRVDEQQPAESARNRKLDRTQSC